MQNINALIKDLKNEIKVVIIVKKDYFDFGIFSVAQDSILVTKIGGSSVLSVGMILA